jgi:VanZ family protein
MSDKLIHAGEFGLFSVLLCRALRGHMTTWPSTRIAWLSVLTATVYGATDEFHQLFVPQRSAEFVDLVADSLGATLAVWGWLKAGLRWPWLQ